MQKITELLSKGKSPYHVTEWTGKQLQEAGYEELKLQESWRLHAGGKYYVRPYSGMVAAFAVPEQLDRKTALRPMLAHTDFPCFKIKPNPGEDEGLQAVKCGAIWRYAQKYMV